MNSFHIMGISIICYMLALKVYGQYLARNYNIDDTRLTPAKKKNDGIDFVPAKNWLVLFGHHFSSICGAGPIVGPVLACAYWGWGVSLLWIVVGAIWMGAVADFSALVVSMKGEGKSIAAIAGYEISKRAKLFFSIFIWISLILVIAVFSIFAAKTFIQEPDAVIPSFGLIPIAVMAGFFIYRKNQNDIFITIVSLGILGLLLFIGRNIPITMPEIFHLSSEEAWILLLLSYCFIASIVPVNILLQPRDYLASFILFGVIAIGILGIVIDQPDMNVPAFTAFNPTSWEKAGPLWPMLFVTIACGAISGFHSLVSSGTTSKQIASECHACRIGYGGMLLESTVGVMVLICVSAGLSNSELTQHLKNGGPIAAFSHGYGSISKIFLGDYGKAFAILALNAFILTTLDTATRITRYITSELFSIQNKYFATMITVIASGLLAFTGKWTLLWPAFGAANQLIAGMTLLVASCWLLYRRRNYLVTLIPACIMLITTMAAFLIQFFYAIQKTDLVTGKHTPDIFIAVVTVALITVAFSVLFETVKKFKALQHNRK